MSSLFWMLAGFVIGALFGVFSVCVLLIVRDEHDDYSL